MNAASSRILIVGGYGKVGSSIAHFLLENSPHQITIAGRSLEKAQTALNSLPSSENSFAIKLDVQDSLTHLKKTVASYDYVVVCIDSVITHLAQACLDLGVNYVDVTSDDSFHQKIENLSSRENIRSTILLSVGLTPGITNLLAKKIMTDFPQVEKIDLSIILGSGEKHCEAAVMWTLKELFKSARQSSEKIQKVFYGV